MRKRLILFPRPFHNTHIGRKLKSRDTKTKASHELTKQKTSQHVPTVTFFNEPNMLKREDHYYVTKTNKVVYGFREQSIDHDS